MALNTHQLSCELWGTFTPHLGDCCLPQWQEHTMSLSILILVVPRTAQRAAGGFPDTWTTCTLDASHSCDFAARKVIRSGWTRGWGDLGLLACPAQSLLSMEQCLGFAPCSASATPGSSSSHPAQSQGDSGDSLCRETSHHCNQVW